MVEWDTDYIFNIQTPLGFYVHCTEEYWQRKIVFDHPVMENRVIDVQQTLENPQEVRLSRSDSDVYLFYATDAKRFVCAVTRRTNGEGFLITAYPTDKIKRGEIVWSK